MIVLECILIVLLTVTVAENLNSVPKNFYDDDDEACKKMAKKPYFEAEIVVGKRWTAYYAWNLNKKANDNCLEFSFKNATRRIINRIWNNMYEYLDIQPPWQNASLVMSTNSRHEMLLFSDKTIPGRFTGVADVIRTEDDAPKKKKSVPLFDIHMKLIQENRYLVISDCNIGITTLSIRNDMVASRGILEILGLATALEIGEGSLVCALKKNLGDFFEGEIVSTVPKEIVISK